MSKIALTPNANGSGVFTLASPNSNTNRTITLPDESVTLGAGTPSIDDNGNATAITIDSSENVGIGTTSPTLPLDIVSNAAADALKIRARSNGNDYGTLTFYNNAGTTKWADIQSNVAKDLRFYTNGGTEAMRIDSSGNVGIGNFSSGYIFTTGETRLSVGDGTEHAGIQVLSGTNKWGGLEFADDTTDSNGQGLIAYYHPDNYMQFKTAGAEHMRLESGGNLLLRSTDAANITGHSSPYLEFRAGQTNGQNVTLGKIKGSSPGGWGGDIIFETKAANGQVNDTTVERLRIRESGGITFNGDTANANTLNDYEEGTFTVGVTQGTIGGGDGVYVKVGDLVFCSFTAGNFSNTSSGNPIEFTGLPFTNNSVSHGSNGSVFCRYTNKFPDALQVSSGAAQCRMWKSNSTAYETVNYNNLTNGGYAYFFVNVTYRAA